MIDQINLPLILAAAFIGAASPGPSTLAIAGTSMNAGRKQGLALALGVVTGSFGWSVSAAFGLGALMLANGWVLEMVRYLGAGYLLYLAIRSGRAALSAAPVQLKTIATASPLAAYLKGLGLHLTNPKAILFFGALFSVGIPAGSSAWSLVIVIAAVGCQSLIIFVGYALLFSSRRIAATYVRLRRPFEALLAIAFGAAGVKILTEDLG